MPDWPLVCIQCSDERKERNERAAPALVRYMGIRQCTSECERGLAKRISSVLTRNDGHWCLEFRRQEEGFWSSNAWTGTAVGSKRVQWLGSLSQQGVKGHRRLPSIDHSLLLCPPPAGTISWNAQRPSFSDEVIEQSLKTIELGLERCSVKVEMWEKIENTPFV